MFLACGLSGYNYSMYHLFNHAFFKALLFLTAGYIIHSISNEQDIRKMGGLVKIFPFSYVMILLASLSLMGFPFFSGFYSKERIIELFFNKHSTNLYDLSSYNLYFFFQLICTLAVICTIIYSMRLLVFVFFTMFNGFYNYLSNTTIQLANYIKYIPLTLHNINNIHYGSIFLVLPLILLCFLSVSSGYLFKDLMIGEGIISWNNSIYFSYLNNESLSLNNLSFYLINYEFNEYIRGVTLFWVLYFTISFTFFYIFARTYVYYLKLNNVYYISLTRTLVEKYIYFNKIFIDLSSFVIFYVSYYITYLLIDKGLIERFGPLGLFNIIKTLILKNKSLENYYTTHYLLLLLVGYFIIILLIL
jgi:NADH-ubiquinone oxidoreductase chain 5